MRWPLTAAIAFFTLASIGCAASDNLGCLFRFACAGIRRRNADSDSVCRSIHLFRPRTQGIATTIAGNHGGARHRRSGLSSRLDTQMYSWHWLFWSMSSRADCLRAHAVSLARTDTELEGAKFDGFVAVSAGEPRSHALEIGLSSRRTMDGFSSICISLFP